MCWLICAKFDFTFRVRTGLSAAISACEKGTAWKRAVSTFATALVAVKPDAICISAVTSALENCASNLTQLSVDTCADLSFEHGTDV